MKTVAVKFVVDDDDAAWVERTIEKMMEYELDSAPMFSFECRNPTRQEKAWRKRYDAERIDAELP